jgi:hypothetical protein
MVSLSSFLASLIFVILTNFNLLVGTEITYFARPDTIHHTFYLCSHPYDSMIEIWSMPLLFIGEIVVALIFYWFGMLNRYISTKLRKKALLSRF